MEIEKTTKQTKSIKDITFKFVGNPNKFALWQIEKNVNHLVREMHTDDYYPPDDDFAYGIYEAAKKAYIEYSEWGPESDGSMYSDCCKEVFDLINSNYDLTYEDACKISNAICDIMYEYEAANEKD